MPDNNNDYTEQQNDHQNEEASPIWILMALASLCFIGYCIWDLSMTGSADFMTSHPVLVGLALLVMALGANTDNENSRDDTDDSNYDYGYSPYEELDPPEHRTDWGP